MQYTLCVAKGTEQIFTIKDVSTVSSATSEVCKTLKVGSINFKRVKLSIYVTFESVYLGLKQQYTEIFITIDILLTTISIVIIINTKPFTFSKRI